MPQSNLDRCPRCGTPYMSSALPGETAENRYCYTCQTQAGEKASAAAAASVSDDLELQPIEGEAPKAGPRASGRAPAQVRPRTAAPRVAPPAGTSARFAAANIPQIAPPASHGDTGAGFHFPLKPVLGAAAVLLASFGAYRVFFVQSPAQERAERAAAVEVVVAKKEANAAVAANVPKAAPKPAPIKKESEKRGPENPVGAIHSEAVQGVAAGLKPDQKDAVVAEAPAPKSSLDAGADLLLIRPKSRAARQGDDEEEGPVIRGKTPPVQKTPEKKLDADVTADATAVADANNALIVPPDPPPEAAKPEKEMKAGNDLDGDKPKKRNAIKELITGKKEEEPPPEPKKENPFTPKIIAVTATEPKLLPLDIERIGGNDKTMTQQLAVFLPNWKVRDANFETSKIGIKHGGRDNAVALTPMNDVLGAKLAATVEIPKSFAGSNPMLLFEVASSAPSKSWLMSVKAMGVDLIAKGKIQSDRDNTWQNVAVPLAALADRHFDLQIEVYSANKAKNSKLPMEAGYIRNVRMEWTGMKK